MRASDDQVQLAAAQRLFGQHVNWAHRPDDVPFRVTGVMSDGMVTIDRFTGAFAPHLFVIAKNDDDGGTAA